MSGWALPIVLGIFKLYDVSGGGSESVIRCKTREGGVDPISKNHSHDYLTITVALSGTYITITTFRTLSIVLFLYLKRFADSTLFSSSGLPISGDMDKLYRLGPSDYAFTSGWRHSPISDKR
jgi:hypothetical protein